MKKLNRLLNRLSENLACSTSFIEIHGTTELILSGCKKIVDYSTDRIACETVSGFLLIEGAHLELDVFHGDILTVCGCIKGVYLNKDYAY